MQIPLVTRNLKTRSVNLTAEERINLYPEATGVDQFGNPSYSLIGTPGTSLFATLGNTPVRGMIRAANGTFVAVGGNTVYTIDTDGNTTSIGTIGTTNGVVRMADNGTQIVIADGNTVVYYTDLSSVAELTELNTIISDNGYEGPQWVTSQDGYIIVAFPNSDDFFISAVDNATSWSSLDYSSADGKPGYIVAVISHRDELWFLKDNSYEIWYNSGNADFPFEKHQGAEGEIGCVAAGSVERLGNSLFWLGENEEGAGQAFMADGYNVTPITDHGMSYVFNTFSTLTDATSWTYQQEGHSFYLLDFPIADQSWAFDLTTGMRHRRGYLNAITNNFERQRGHVQCHFNGKDYVGDYQTGQIFELDLDTYTDNGQEIQRTVILPHVKNGTKRLFIKSFQLEMETGVGLNTGQGSDPKAMLQFSTDRGHTFGNEHWADIGAMGKHNQRVKWWMLGSVLDTWTPKIVISDPVKVVISAAHIEGR